MARPFTYITGVFRPAPQWVAPSGGSVLPTTAAGTTFTQTLGAVSATGESLTFSLASGTLPPGLSISGNTLSGSLQNPAADTTYSFILKATGATTGTYAECMLSMTVTRVAAADPYSAQVLYLYRGDGNYLDASSSNRTLAALNTSAQNGVNTSIYKYGTGSLGFNGSGMPANFDIRVPAGGSTFNVTGDFTFEFWMNSASTANGQTANMVMFVTAFGAAGNTTATEPTNCIAVFAQPSSSTGPNRITVKLTTNGTPYSGTTNVNDGTWRHIAIVRSGTAANNVKVYQNGVQEVQFTYTGAVDFGQQYGLRVGKWVGEVSTTYYKGYLDDIRLTTAARYSGTFTPPTQSYPYP